jgi:hypothetical protein
VEDKTSEMAVTEHQWGDGILDRQAAAASDFITRQYGKVLVKITIMTNSWHNKHYRGSYVENVSDLGTNTCSEVSFSTTAQVIHTKEY